MKTVTLTKGLPGSGKSTWARDICTLAPGKYKLVSKDELRVMLDNGRWSKKNEQFVLAQRDAIILHALDEGYNVIVHDTNLAPIHESHIRELVKGRAAVFIKDFCDVPLEECIKRDLARPNSVGEAVIRKMYHQYLAPKTPVIEHDPTLPNAIICDLDGTLCLFGDANPYDRDFSCDTVNPVVQMILYAMETDFRPVIFTSGRSARFRQQTEEWLDRHGFDAAHLYMRAEGDTRKDVIVKQEMYETHIKGRWNILFVLDDRTSVVNLWRSIGLTCLQVAPGDF